MDLRKSAVIRHQDRPGIDKSLSASEVIGQIGGSSEISGNPVPRSTRNRQVVERSWVYGQIEVVIWRGLSYTTRERARGDNGFSLVSYLLGWLVPVTNQVR